MGNRGLRLVLERQGRSRARLGRRWSDDRGHPARIRFGHSLPQMGRASRSRTPFGGKLIDRILMCLLARRAGEGGEVYTRVGGAVVVHDAMRASGGWIGSFLFFLFAGFCETEVDTHH